MEKFSAFKDPFTGSNPFCNPKRQKVKAIYALVGIIKIPILVLTFIFPTFIKYLINIVYTKKELQNGVFICNKSSIFDFYVLKYLYPKANLYELTETNFYRDLETNKIITKLNLKKMNIVYIEECRSNNSCIIRFVKEINCDYVIGLKYSESCIFMDGNIFFYYLYFLSSKNTVTIKLQKTNKCTDLMKILGFNQSIYGIDKRNEYLKALKAKKYN